MSKNEQRKHDTKNLIFAYVIITSAIIAGGGPLFLFMVFLYLGSFSVIELGLQDGQGLWLDTILCVTFFVQHSYMIRTSFRKRFERYIPQQYYGAFYAVCSGVTLLLLLIFWQESAQIIVVLEEPFRWLLHFAFFLSIVGLVWGVRSLRSFDIIGRGRILAYVHKKKLPRMPFTIRGPYRYVRHPFYFFILVMIWSCPVVSLDRLLFNFFWSVWILVGTVLEERDLVTEFGQDYYEYQQKVPMLFPWRISLKSFEKRL